MKYYGFMEDAFMDKKAATDLLAILTSQNDLLDSMIPVVLQFRLPQRIRATFRILLTLLMSLMLARSLQYVHL